MPSAAPEQEGAPLDPQAGDARRERVRRVVRLLDSVKNGVLAGLRQVSFWLMKNRARTVGESGHAPVRRRAAAGVPQRIGSPDGPQLRLHRRLVDPRRSRRQGPSAAADRFGWCWCRERCRCGRTATRSRTQNKSGLLQRCAEEQGGERTDRDDAVDQRSRCGHRVSAGGRAGRSKFDFAPGRFSECSAASARSGFRDRPRRRVPMLGVDRDYQFASGRIYNLESTTFIPRTAASTARRWRTRCGRRRGPGCWSTRHDRCGV